MADVIVLEYASLLLGIFLAGVGIMAGHHRRYRSHQIKVKRDSGFVCILMIELFIILLLNSEALVQLTSDEMTVVVALAMVFDMFFIIGYRLANPGDVTLVEIYGEDMSWSDTSPIVHYYDQYNNLCNVPQSLKASFLIALGAKYYLEMDLSTVNRSRAQSFYDGRKKRRRGRVIPVAYYSDPEILDPVGRFRFGSEKIYAEDGTITRVPRYLLHLPCESQEIVFADSATIDPISFQAATEVRNDAVKEIVALKQQISRLEIELVKAKFIEAGEIISGLFDCNVDRKETRRIIEEGLIKYSARKAKETDNTQKKEEPGNDGRT